MIAVHPTIADSASAAWRSGLTILTGFALAVGVRRGLAALGVHRRQPLAA